MGIRPVENQMMLSRPPEAVNDRARDMRMQGLNAGVMQHEEEIVSQQEMNRAQAAQNVHESKVHGDGDSKQQQEQQKKKEPKEAVEVDREELLKQKASERILDLPVERGKYAQRQQHKIDIVL